MDPNCAYPASKVKPQAQRHCWPCAAGKTRPWPKREAALPQRRHLVVEEVCRQEQSTRCAKTVSQVEQGQWVRWEGVERRKFSWRELLDMEAFHTSFLRAKYDLMPSPSNLNLNGTEKTLRVPFAHLPQNLRHILVGCKTSL